MTDRRRSEDVVYLKPRLYKIRRGFLHSCTLQKENSFRPLPPELKNEMWLPRVTINYPVRSLIAPVLLVFAFYSSWIVSRDVLVKRVCALLVSS